jgi:hypothetical protein
MSYGILCLLIGVIDVCESLKDDLTNFLDTSIGYNSLFNSKARVEGEDLESTHDKPDGRRIWTWAILCDDGNSFLFSEPSNIFRNCDIDQRESFSQSILPKQ